MTTDVPRCFCKASYSQDGVDKLMPDTAAEVETKDSAPLGLCEQRPSVLQAEPGKKAETTDEPSLDKRIAIGRVAAGTGVGSPMPTRSDRDLGMTTDVPTRGSMYVVAGFGGNAGAGDDTPIHGSAEERECVVGRVGAGTGAASPMLTRRDWMDNTDTKVCSHGGGGSDTCDKVSSFVSASLDRC